MDIEYIKEQIERIRQVSGDAELAHKMEDALFHSVLWSIASGARNPIALATEALRSKEHVFDRYMS